MDQQLTTIIEWCIRNRVSYYLYNRAHMYRTTSSNFTL